jgi:hypothetical protein
MEWHKAVAFGYYEDRRPKPKTSKAPTVVLHGVGKANLSGGRRTTTGRLIPSCTFIDPELGRVGLSESEARGREVPVKVARLAVSAVPRARTLGETHGFMKAVIESGTDRILGFTMLGAEPSNWRTRSIRGSEGIIVLRDPRLDVLPILRTTLQNQ